MKRVVYSLLFLLGLCIVSCTNTNNESDDNNYSKKIIGTWQLIQEEWNYPRSGKQGTDYYEEDEVMYTFKKSGMVQISELGESGFLILKYVLDGSSLFFFDEEDELYDACEIKSLTDKEMILYGIDNDMEYVDLFKKKQ